MRKAYLLLLGAHAAACALLQPATIPNFRDVGGMTTPNGRVVRPGILHRSASPANASLSDAEAVRTELGVRVVLDLRGEKDAVKEGSFARRQLAVVIDIDNPPWLDWFHGGLNLHSVHHLFPRMCREHYRAAHPRVLELCRKHGVLIVTDEIYEWILYDDGGLHEPLAVLDPENVVVVSSISKTARATGWRIGWVVASASRTQRIRAVHDQLVACVRRVRRDAGRDLGAPRCSGGFTPSTRLVSWNGGGGWFFMGF